MYKIIFKLYYSLPNNDRSSYIMDAYVNEGRFKRHINGVTNPYRCSTYPAEYMSLRRARRTLRKVFSVGAEWKEAPVSRLGDLNVVRSYYVPGFDKDINARFYIIEEDD